jgi:predicted  nucleic acid-binding Zn-ribbon protein
MHRLPNTLFALQSYELAVDHARARLAEIERALSTDEQVAACQTALEASESASQHAQAQVKDLELEMAGLTHKIKEVNELLYGGGLHPKELQDRQDELASLQNRYTTLENRQSELNAVLQQLNAEHQANQEALTAAVSERDRIHLELIAERGTLDTKIKANLRKHKATLGEVPEEVYKQYRLLRKKKHGQAVAIMQGNHCSACGIEQNWTVVQEVLADDQLVYCQGCGRILVSH